MGDALAHAQSTLLQAICNACREAAVQEMLGRVEEVVDAEAVPSSSPFINRIQQASASNASWPGMMVG
ncbi:hypothetical protein HaLaN_27855 [Haematococcus lacustris]|uniref:Uncharacterized protein n=1 Tax=Haematococcus lacustris TaxID=44745 RepID=A0A6A0A9X7_HAELA|nr:hypothetical protein HaLaN_27855 [Haematococcus lacustris]